MNQKVILILLSVMMLSTVSYAQKVIVEGAAVIIDCSEMDPKLYVSEKKKPTTNATNTTAGSTDLSVISSKKSNEKVYKKFEVHKTDNGKGINWKAAIELCANLNNNGIGWRLPTQRELMLVVLLGEKLYANGVTVPTTGAYWSATEDDYQIGAWYVSSFGGIYPGNSRTIHKNQISSVRCIRDI